MVIVNHMVNLHLGLDRVFSALSDSTRRAILARLALGPSTVMELAEPFEISLPAVSKHLKVLERAGLLAREIDGRVHHCQLMAAPMESAASWMERYREFWERQLDALSGYLNAPGTAQPGAPDPPQETSP